MLIIHHKINISNFNFNIFLPAEVKVRTFIILKKVIVASSRLLYVFTLQYSFNVQCYPPRSERNIAFRLISDPFSSIGGCRTFYLARTKLILL